MARPGLTPRGGSKRWLSARNASRPSSTKLPSWKRSCPPSQRVQNACPRFFACVSSSLQWTRRQLTRIHHLPRPPPQSQRTARPAMPGAARGPSTARRLMLTGSESALVGGAAAPPAIPALPLGRPPRARAVPASLVLMRVIPALARVLAMPGQLLRGPVRMLALPGAPMLTATTPTPQAVQATMTTTRAPITSQSTMPLPTVTRAFPRLRRRIGLCRQRRRQAQRRQAQRRALLLGGTLPLELAASLTSSRPVTQRPRRPVMQSLALFRPRTTSLTAHSQATHP